MKNNKWIEIKSKSKQKVINKKDKKKEENKRENIKNCEKKNNNTLLINITPSISKKNNSNLNMTKCLTDNSSDNYSDEENFKKILCHNIIYNKECKYGDKCIYAHSLEEQNVNDTRKKIYDILNSDCCLNNIDLHKDVDLYNNMIELTRYCKNCNVNYCIGGYNCKSGAYNKNYCICINDLNYGNCSNNNCNYIHLTNRGLVPYYLFPLTKRKLKTHFDKSAEKTENDEIKNNKIVNDEIKNDENTNEHDDDSNISIISENSLSDDDKIAEKDEIINIICNKSIFV